ncbi:hypothetical protein [Spirosoma fluviale]|uniref:Uncharacterized protein n=1 Tax=Spirosoma fluviale TaxID=1597977 RepID=A0A286GBA1_9BACT|nr:hypothetical protein [Spirosoma fluviale]SOD92781.1 hypothetical protein SAMN06269250_4157 [Spirosoma fluviale]
MSEPDDKSLHDWVRRSLDAYRPDEKPAGWAQVQRRIRRRLWWRRGIVVGCTGLLVWVVGWLVYRPKMLPFNRTITITKPEASVMTEPYKHPERPGLRSSGRETVNRKRGRTSAYSANRPTFSRQSRPRLQFPIQLMAIRALKPLPGGVANLVHHRRVALSPEEMAITRQMLTGDFGSDSTSYRILDRNIRQWPDAVIVCDLTTSMYPYTTQLFAWFAENARHPAIKGMLFFTDCDSLGRQTYPGGPAGKMYICREPVTARVLPIILEAARNTVRNNDDAENTVEALLAAQKAFPEARHLVLVADNLSDVKDMDLLKTVKKPVHVILCGTTGGDTTQAFQPAYSIIASQTNGSLHTLEDDLDPSRLSDMTTLRVGDHYYRYRSRRNQFKLTPYHHRPRRFLGFLWL